MPVYLLYIDVPENVVWDPPAYARLSPERYGLNGSPRFCKTSPAPNHRRPRIPSLRKVRHAVRLFLRTRNVRIEVKS